MNQQISYLKWSPANSTENRLKSVMKDKHKTIGNEVMETILQEGNEFINKHDKREEQLMQINQREMVAQKSMNPFFSSNYLEDLRVQEQFLTPQNSNIHNEIRK